MESILTFFLFTVGTSIGSFLNVLVERTAQNRTLKGRSQCENCKKKLNPTDLIPIISYLKNRGKCRYCQSKLSIQYLLTETITGLAFVAIYLLVTQNHFHYTDFRGQLLHIQHFFPLFPLIFHLVIASSFISLFLSDAKFGMLYDKITIPTILFVISYQILTAGYLLIESHNRLNQDQFGRYLIEAGFFTQKAGELLTPLLYTWAGSVSIGLFFLLLIVVTRGRGMGGGDVKLGVLVGLVSTWPYMILTLMISFLTGSLYGLILILRSKNKQGLTIPFGPFLIIGCLVTMFAGKELFDLYLVHLLGLEPLR